MFDVCGDSGQQAINAEFISAARNAIPDLEAVCEEFEQQKAGYIAMLDRAYAAESALAALRGQVAAEREECAQIADSVADLEDYRSAYDERGNINLYALRLAVWDTAKNKIASAIRARAALATEEGKK